MLEAGTHREPRLAALLRGAIQWRDPDSAVRHQAREALRDGDWPAATVERALDDVLLDFEAALDAPTPIPPTANLGAQAILAILPGNIIGPAIACSYCAGVAGVNLIVKSAHNERQLAEIVATQFDDLGAPLRGLLKPMYWQGGDERAEAAAFAGVSRVIVFGEDRTIASVRQRAPASTSVTEYGDAVSVAFVSSDADIAKSAHAASWDVAMFDQRGCMSPQTVYVAGAESRAVLFAHALALELAKRENDLPRARPDDAEKLALSDVIRRLHVTALPAKSHALGTVQLGPAVNGVPGFVVGVEAYSAPACIGFGRVVIVKPCADAQAAARAARTLGSKLETVGLAGSSLACIDAGARRVCALGVMQRPPFGYRPTIADFRLERV